MKLCRSFVRERRRSKVRSKKTAGSPRLIERRSSYAADKILDVGARSCGQYSTSCGLVMAVTSLGCSQTSKCSGGVSQDSVMCQQISFLGICQAVSQRGEGCGEWRGFNAAKRDDLLSMSTKSCQSSKVSWFMLFNGVLVLPVMGVIVLFKQRLITEPNALTSDIRPRCTPRQMTSVKLHRVSLVMSLGSTPLRALALRAVFATDQQG